MENELFAKTHRLRNRSQNIENKEKSMKKHLTGIYALAIISAFIFTQSAQAMGLFYTETTYPVTATGAKATKDLKYLKKGVSKSKCILGLVELGDAGIDEAAKSANIRQISFIDIKVKSIFIFISRITTEVYGE